LPPVALSEIEAGAAAWRLTMVSAGSAGMPSQNYIRWFSDIRAADVPLFGGNNASLGGLYSTQGVRIPNGFTTAIPMSSAFAARRPPTIPKSRVT
jgi:hypothetical protein